jgi:hypothetical protein
MDFKNRILYLEVIVLSFIWFMNLISTFICANQFVDKKTVAKSVTIIGESPISEPEKPIDETLTGPIKVYVGNEKFEKDNRIDIQGIVSINGDVKGTIRCHDMNELYKAYDLKPSDNSKVLFEKIKADECRSRLIKVFENAKEVDLDYHIPFILKGNDSNINGIYITGKAVILEYKENKKKFISNRIQDSGAVTKEGEPYAGYVPLIEATPKGKPES